MKKTTRVGKTMAAARSAEDLLSAVMSRRTKYDQREPGVREACWEECQSDDTIMRVSTETVELLALAVKEHTGCGNVDFEIKYSYGSGIGTNIVAKCPRCGKRYDITDYGNW